MYTLLIPTGNIRKETKSGGGAFWQSFWEKKVADNIESYQSQYQNRIRRSKSSLSQFNSTLPDNTQKKYYVDVKLTNEKKASKSNVPTKIWTESGLEVVATREDEEGTVLTLGGEKEDFVKWESLVDASAFDEAMSGGGKTRDISRELYAVTDIQNKNSTLEGRVSYLLNELIEENFEGEIDCIIELRSDVTHAEYDAHYSELCDLLETARIHKRDLDFFITNTSFLATLSIIDVRSLLEDEAYNYINRIKTEPHFVAQRATPNMTLSNVQVGALLTNETVGLIDSGVNNQVLNPLVSHHLNYLPTGTARAVEHGTNVASRLVFGDAFFEKVSNGEEISPTVRIVDIVVLREERGDVSAKIDDLMKAIKESPVQAGEVTIFNLSISSREPILDSEPFDELTELIDTVSHNHDVLFVVAVGNQTGNYALPYNDIFNTGDDSANICIPSDALNALSVGSISRNVSDETICSAEGYPAPFTRKGGVRGDVKKPELVANGGNVRIDNTGAYGEIHRTASTRSYGVETLATTDFSKDIGTSLSAPIVSREAALILDHLKRSSLPSTVEMFATNKANLVKALLIHSTSQREQVKVDDDGVKRAFGSGEPDHAAGIFDDSENQVSIVYANRIIDTEKKHKLSIKLPEALLEKNLEFTFTFLYNPPVNRTIKEYKLIDLSATPRLVMPVIENGEVVDMKYKALYPKHSWENHRTNKYSTTSHFKKKVQPLKCVDLEVLVQMTVADLLANKMGSEEIPQDYAFVLTIKDLSESGQLRSLILQENELSELVQNIVEVQV
jgi:hypothetical protein